MRKPFLKLLLPGLGYMFMGNLLSTVMTISLAMFRTEILITGLSVLLGIAIYLLLVAVPAYKDGLDENTKRRNKSVEAEPVKKWRWALVGVILWGVMLVPSILFLLLEYNVGVYRLINGAVNPLSVFFVEAITRGIEPPVVSVSLHPIAPYVFMGFYALTVPACHIGFMLGLGDKLNKDKIMYE
jgi:hypothetical protein